MARIGSQVVFFLDIGFEIKQLLAAVRGAPDVLEPPVRQRMKRLFLAVARGVLEMQPRPQRGSCPRSTGARLTPSRPAGRSSPARSSSVGRMSSRHTGRRQRVPGLPPSSGEAARINGMLAEPS